MAELKITLTLDELHEMLIQACECAAGLDGEGGDYTNDGIAFQIVRGRKLLGRTFVVDDMADIRG